MHLVRRSTGFGPFFARIGRAFLGGSSDWQGEDCQLAMTPTGVLWVAAAASPEANPTGPPADEPVTVNIHNYMMGDHNTLIQHVEVGLERDLVALRQLLAALTAERLAMTGDMADALRTLQDAVAHRRPYTPASRDALRFVLSKSGDVLLGVLSNAVFTVLQHLLGR
jgi:hypothetical protein